MREKLTQEQIEAIREAAGKATPGPWIHDDGDGYGANGVWERQSPSGGSNPGRYIAEIVGDDAKAEDNASHISNCDPQTIIALCDMAEMALTYEAVLADA